MLPFFLVSSTGQRPASYCHGVVSVMLVSVRPSVRSFVHSSVRACKNLFLQKTSQKLLTGILPNFTGMFLRWSSFKFFQIIVFYEEAIVIALCPSCLCPSVRPFIRSFIRSSVHACKKLFLQKTSPQKLLTGFLRNFTGMFLRWSSFIFLQISVFYEEFWVPWRSK